MKVPSGLQPFHAAALSLSGSVSVGLLCESGMDFKSHGGIPCCLQHLQTSIHRRRGETPLWMVVWRLGRKQENHMQDLRSNGFLGNPTTERPYQEDPIETLPTCAVSTQRNHRLAWRTRMCILPAGTPEGQHDRNTGSTEPMFRPYFSGFAPPSGRPSNLQGHHSENKATVTARSAATSHKKIL